MAGRIYLVRHGDTVLNDNERERGWSMAPLNADGRADAERAAGKLKGKGIEIIVSSDLRRAEQTAHIIGAAIGVEPQFSSQLRTWNLGEFTGRLCSEVEPLVQEYIRSKPDEPVPGGESFNAFKQRIFAAVALASQQAGDRTLLLVVHSRIMKILGKPGSPGSIEELQSGYSGSSMMAAAKRLPGNRTGSVFRHMRAG